MTISAIRVSMLIGAVLASAVVTAAAADLPPLPAGLAAPSKTLMVPSFNLPQAAGGTVRSSDLHGKVVIARFWATW